MPFERPSKRTSFELPKGLGCCLLCPRAKGRQKWLKRAKNKLAGRRRRKPADSQKCAQDAPSIIFVASGICPSRAKDINLPGTSSPAARTQKKRSKTRRPNQKSTPQCPDVNLSATLMIKTSPRCKANVNQCKLFQHFVLRLFLDPDTRNYATFSTLRAEFQYQTILHFVLCPVVSD